MRSFSYKKSYRPQAENLTISCDVKLFSPNYEIEQSESACGGFSIMWAYANQVHNVKTHFGVPGPLLRETKGLKITKVNFYWTIWNFSERARVLGRGA